MNYFEYSVLMSVYYKEKPNNLKKALESTVNQTIIPNQIVLVKDGPLTDDLESVISEYLQEHHDIKWTILENSENIGLGKSLKKGLRYCENNLVARADTDDINKLNRMQSQIEEFIKNPELSVCGSSIIEFNENIENIISKRNVPQNSEEILKTSKSKNPINHMTVMFKKDDVVKAGNYIDFPYFEDYFLWIRMLENDCEFLNINNPLVYARVADDFFSRRGGFQYFQKEYFFQKELRKRNYINYNQYCRNLITRCFVRLLPKKILAYVYVKYTRN